MNQRTGLRRSRGGAAVAALLAGLLCWGGLAGLAGPAAAATRTVTLTGNGPSPSSITITSGDRVVFVNADDVTHTVTDNAGPWSFRASIRPGGSATTAVFNNPGFYGYNDAFFVAVVQQNAEGSINVRQPAATVAPTPKPTPKPTLKPSLRPTTKPTATQSPAPSASPSPSSSPAGTSSPIPSPSLGGVPTVPVPPTSGPTPAVAPPVLSPTPVATEVAYGPVSEIVQPSAHRYGLPVLLALMAAAAVLSLLVRFLLAQPVTAQPGGETAPVRRTGPDGVVDGDQA